MNIKELKNDGLTIQVEMNFVAEDYTDKRKKILNKVRRDAELKGFRKGMAPMSLIEKMHGQQALAESVNDLISETLNSYIQDNKLSIIGEPLPVEESENKNEWKVGAEFNFVFEIAMAPKVEVALSKEDKITYYKVNVDAKSKEEAKAGMLKQFGKLENSEEVKDEDFIIADFVQGETRVEGTYVSLKGMAQAGKDIFVGKKVADEMDLNVVEVFPNETDRAAMLKVKKEELAGMEPMWHMTIKEVKTFVDATIGQEFYNQAFGEGVVNNDEEFEAKLVEKIEAESVQEADYRFMLDARDYIINKCDVKLPEDFMKRWLFLANDGKFTMEQIEKDFPLFLKDFRWQSISQFIMKEQKFEITKEAIEEQAIKLASYQFAMYGMNNVPEEHLKNYAQSILQNEKESRRVYEKVEQDMVINYVRSTVTLEETTIDSDKLHEMNEAPIA